MLLNKYKFSHFGFANRDKIAKVLNDFVVNDQKNQFDKFFGGGPRAKIKFPKWSASFKRLITAGLTHFHTAIQISCTVNL